MVKGSHLLQLYYNTWSWLQVNRAVLEFTFCLQIQKSSIATNSAMLPL
ncbi:hypothetical protein RUMCAL_02975 [Ruminococcus callidus ATCC 27760]|uniref:Uncharacterized protein n=1 Tax=Ruminococcus callidus ATCC 27760 TaxID=411473 RepID=U2KAF8_9FIRM|nr:hypothetical protein RUMCAL_02975 [Ruminococcus callidus ATCC 27760]